MQMCGAGSDGGNAASRQPRTTEKAGAAFMIDAIEMSSARKKKQMNLQALLAQKHTQYDTEHGGHPPPNPTHTSC